MTTKYTNKLGLPEPILKALENDPYTSEGSDYTATGLLAPPRMAQLLKTNDVTEDAGDVLARLQGQLMHLLLERSGKKLEAAGYIVEKRFKQAYNVSGQEYVVSAQVDLFDPAKGILSDYKYTSVAASKHGLKEEHRLQLNLQAHLLWLNGYHVRKAEVILLLRDWSAEKVYEGYPVSPVIKQTVTLMKPHEVDEWVSSRIIAHETAKITLPLCSDEERWSRPTFAVMKSLSVIKATRVFDSLAEANDFIAAKDSSMVVVERAGKSIRCMRYCPVRNVCEQAKSLQTENDSQVTSLPDKDGFIKVS